MGRTGAHLVAISQRLARDSHGQWVDSLECSYAALLAEHQVDVVAFPNNPQHVAALLARLRPDRILLSGGGEVDGQWRSSPPQNPSREQTEALLIAYAIQNRVPLLGICRGMQFLNVYFGGSVRMLKDVSATVGDHPPKLVHEVALVEPRLVSACQGAVTAMVNSFHNEGILKSTLSQDLVPCALYRDLLVEACFHRELPLAGVQWHPEREERPTVVSSAILNAFLAGSLYWGPA